MCPVQTVRVDVRRQGFLVIGNCYDRAASVPSRGTIMIYFRPRDGRSLRYNVNVRHLKVLVVPLFPLWIIGAFCVKDSKWLLNFVVVFCRTCAKLTKVRRRSGPGPRRLEFPTIILSCLRNRGSSESAGSFEGQKLTSDSKESSVPIKLVS